MSIQRRTKFIINFEGGTQFQHERMREALKCVIIAWKTFYEMRHKKNLIKLEEREWTE